MSKRTRHPYAAMWVATIDLPAAPSHPFYRRLNRLLAGAQPRSFVEGLRARFYETRMGRPSVAPGIYFRLLLVATSKAWIPNAASLGVQPIPWRYANFWALTLSEATPDHSTISRTRRLIDLETHQAVFTWILQRVADAGRSRGGRSA